MTNLVDDVNNWQEKGKKTFTANCHTHTRSIAERKAPHHPAEAEHFNYAAQLSRQLTLFRAATVDARKNTRRHWSVISILLLLSTTHAAAADAIQWDSGDSGTGTRPGNQPTHSPVLSTFI